MSDREERRARRERWLQTVAFLGAVVVFGSVLYAAFVVQRNRAQETAPTLPPSSRIATPHDTPANSPVPTPASTPYTQPYIVHILATPGTTPYPVFVGPYYPYAISATLLPGSVRYRPDFLTPMAGPWVPQVYPTGGLFFVPGGTATPSAGPTPSPESPTP